MALFRSWSYFWSGVPVVVLAVAVNRPVVGGAPQQPADLIGNALADAVEHVLTASGHFGA
jgi:hypothetical protein